MRVGIEASVLVVGLCGCSALIALDHYRQCDGSDECARVVDSGRDESVVDAGAMLCEASADCAPQRPVCSRGACAAIKELSHGASADHACVVLSDGAVWCWGNDLAGQIDALPNTHHTLPTPAPLDPSVKAAHVFTGFTATCVLTADGKIYCWGNSASGGGTGAANAMSPEQFRNSKDIDFRSDLWSVGIVVYEALTGQLPFVGDTVSAVAIAVNEGIARPPSEIDPGLPKALDAWFAKACARQSADRFASARELSNGLREAFSMPIDSRASLPNIGDSLSRSGRVIIRAPNQTMSQWSDETAHAAQPALRDTAFSTSSKPLPAARSRSWMAIAALGIVAVGAAGFWLSRPPKPTAAPILKESATIVVRPTPSTQTSAKPGHDRDIW